ncbi:uncharacterized protein LOC142163153 [Nicotiana tabacum]|uniref:Uncharacterized protein LOC142163153 n=1 Tax=Nicotiana tabacum TaxID=4097 RepID=A0AC58RUZ7_TOBAC
MECIRTVNYIVLVNRETTRPFNATKRLRQGDPTSPFLFALVIESLSRSLYELKKEPTFQHHPRCKKLDITHMSVADDLLLFARVYFCGVKQDVKKQIFDHLRFEQAKISSWTAKNLSYVGRVQLVQSVIFGIQVYWAQLFTFPAKNKEAIAKTCWDLSHKQDKLWIMWIDAYYIKQ